MLRPRKPVVTIINYRSEQKNRWKITKAKRIAQVSFQAKIDASNESTTAESESREIQTQQLMTGVNAPLQISQEQ